MAVWIARDTVRRDARSLEVFYEIGAFTYAFLSGLVAALTVINPHGGHIQTLMVTYALVYGVGISARNAGRPVIAVGQLLLSAVPIMIVSVIVGLRVSVDKEREGLDLTEHGERAYNM